MTGEGKELQAIRKRANRLANALVAASDQFEGIAGLPNSERSEVIGAIRLLSFAAVTWMKTGIGKKRKPRRSPGTTPGWLGGW